MVVGAPQLDRAEERLQPAGTLAIEALERTRRFVVGD
jgi:hypothetical protein